MGSFTPINNGHVAISVGIHGVRNRSRGLGSDYIYDIPDEALPQGSPAPKKRRISWTKAAGRKSTSNLTRPWRKENGKESSQLSTPPDSKKRTSGCLSAQTELFPNLPIIKPIWTPRQLTTTEDAMKANNVAVGKTTMDKLASFRYYPTLQHPPVAKSQDMTDYLHGYTEKSSMADASSHNPASSCLDEPSNVYGETSVVDHDNVRVKQDEEEQCLNQQELALDMLLDSEDDDFPVDDDLEAEMAQFSMPDNLVNEKLSQQLELQSLGNQKLQRNESSGGHFQLSGLSLQTIVVDNNAAPDFQSDCLSSVDSVICMSSISSPLDQPLGWQAALQQRPEQSKTVAVYRSGAKPLSQSPAQMYSMIDDIEYTPLQPFARPGFPPNVHDRSPITGVSSNIILRTCFRIGEAVRESILCEDVGQDSVIELFARVTSSSRGVNPSKLQFQFADLFHDRPPFIRGELESYKISTLQETESRVLLEWDGSPPMVRCLGRLNRTFAGPPGWILHILNIRETDWEEVRWTKGIAGAGMEKSGEGAAFGKL